MNEHIKLLQKEMAELQRNFERAQKKPGVTDVELKHIENKLFLKTEILEVLIAVCTTEK